MNKLTHAILDQREGRIIRSLIDMNASAHSPMAKAEKRNQAKAEFVEIDRYRKLLLSEAKA